MLDHLHKRLISFILPIIVFSCAKQRDQAEQIKFVPKRAEAMPYQVPKEQLSEPEIIRAGIPNILSVAKPKIIPTNTNVFPAGKSKWIKAGVPKKVTPGEDGFSLPKSYPAIEHPIVAGQPEILIANEAASRESNPQGISTFSISQGLPYAFINCIMEDRSGNLWLGTDGGGASKFDGKSLTHFAEKEGLSNNEANAIFEDHDGNIWFGTDEGAFRYDGRSFTHFREKEGLNNDFVECIYQDNSGSIWFGTFGGGVSKF